jgi:hypothetical protein
MLLSAGRFAIYRAETHVFSTLGPRFGDLSKVGNRLAMADCFIRSDMFRISGLDAHDFRRTIETDCRNPGDFLRSFMESVSRAQGMPRWAETTPVHVMYIPQIKATIPNALFIHVVRDGRDVAVSMMKQGWIRPLPIDRRTLERAAGAFWMWVVETGERLGARYPGDYLQVSYEDLAAQPQPALDRIGEFIGQRLDHQEIMRAGVGSVSKPNTSFPGRTGTFTGRWRDELDEPRARSLEALLEPTLRRHGYTSDFSLSGAERLRAAAVRATYRSWFSLRHALKLHTPASRRISLELFEPGAVKSSMVSGE